MLPCRSQLAAWPVTVSSCRFRCSDAPLIVVHEAVSIAVWTRPDETTKRTQKRKKKKEKAFNNKMTQIHPCLVGSDTQTLRLSMPNNLVRVAMRVHDRSWNRSIGPYSTERCTMRPSPGLSGCRSSGMEYYFS